MKAIPLLLLTASIALAADGPSPAELKLREQLRATLLLLRTSETERANLQAAQADLEQRLKDAEAKLEALGKQLAEDKAAADKSIADLTDQVAKRDGDIVQLNETLAKWKASHAQITEIARTKENQRAKFEAKSIALERIAADQRRKNEAMFKLGNEILTRYEKFGLGEALLAREPFVGITRVKFQNLIQDYSDKLVEQVIKPTPPAATPAPVPPRAEPVRRAPRRSEPTPRPARTARGVRNVS